MRFHNRLGSCIADENILAIRSLTFPPYSQGPYSPIVRNVSRLARLLVPDGDVLFPRQHDPSATRTREVRDRGSVENNSGYFELFQDNTTAKHTEHVRHLHSDDMSQDTFVPIYTDEYQWTPWSFRRRGRIGSIGAASEVVSKSMVLDKDWMRITF